MAEINGKQIADKHLGVCKMTSQECKYSHPVGGGENKCCFGLRNTTGCFLDDAVAEEAAMICAIASVETRNGILFPLNKSTLTTKRTQRIMSFVYKGHEYTIHSRAIQQYKCPYCGTENPASGHFHKHFNKKDNPTWFIGRKKLGEDQYAYCFECQVCFEKFFYHDDK